jgi:dTDP-4-dehydrorhamnose reductase/dTDP-4-dehydrorhamnose 3,5-epimerase-like enzyme
VDLKGNKLPTITYTDVTNFWDKVFIREIPKYTDARGELIETFRIDDPVSSHTEMGYYSVTHPFVKRGSHRHLAQKDNFIVVGSNNNRMLYEFMNLDTKETKYFITEPYKSYSIVVEHGILHAYRNISYKTDSITLNYPDKLYKGFDKLEAIDEVRFEEIHKPKNIIVILGANGKLGKALTRTFIENKTLDNYEVLPIIEKIEGSEDYDELIRKLDINFKDLKVTIFNCAAKTNTSIRSTTDNIKSGDTLDKYMWANSTLPYLLGRSCFVRNWDLVQISTNFVYHENKTKDFSFYTFSKKQMEDNFKINKKLLKATIVRVSNLFSNDKDDKNIFTRFKEIIETKGTIEVDPELTINPINVEELSEIFYHYYCRGIFTVTSTDFVNVISDYSKIDEFVRSNFKVEPKIKEGTIKDNFEKFLKDPDSIIIYLKGIKNAFR